MEFCYEYLARKARSMFMAVLTVDLQKQTYRFAINSQSSIKHKRKLFVCLLVATLSHVCFFGQFVTSPGVEPGFWVPETHVISIIRRGYMEKAKLGVFLQKISLNASST